MNEKVLITGTEPKHQRTFKECWQLVGLHKSYMNLMKSHSSRLIMPGKKYIWHFNTWS